MDQQSQKPQKPKRTFSAHIQRNLFVGVLTLIPIAVTWFVINILLGLMSQLGTPFVRITVGLIDPYVPSAIGWLENPTFQSAVAIFSVIFTIYLIGWAATLVVGARIIRAFERFMERIPFVQTIYGATRRLMGALQQQPDNVQRIVLIQFPSDQMRTVGLVTRTFRDEATGEELAAVYVPTTPNPTSGYLEIVPVSKIVSTEWTMDEAMSFIISGGAVAPGESITYSKSRGGQITDIRPSDADD